MTMMPTGPKHTDPVLIVDAASSGSIARATYRSIEEQQAEAYAHGPYPAPRASSGWIAFDLDGTLAHYDRYHDDQRIGPPIAPMVDLARRYLAEGRSVVIFTARVSRAESTPERAAAVARVRELIDAWCLEHLGQRVRVTADKDYRITLFIEDRAVAIETNTGRVLGGDLPD